MFVCSYCIRLHNCNLLLCGCFVHLHYAFVHLHCCEDLMSPIHPRSLQRHQPRVWRDPRNISESVTFDHEDAIMLGWIHRAKQWYWFECHIDLSILSFAIKTETDPPKSILHPTKLKIGMFMHPNSFAEFHQASNDSFPFGQRWLQVLLLLFNLQCNTISDIQMCDTNSFQPPPH